MCLSIPARVIELKDGGALVDVDGNRLDVQLMLDEPVKPGDYLLVHAGFAIQKYDHDEALETIRMLKEALGDQPQ
ncbi:MAG: HypC/HybG/HupF family hydrogenase formation chaperone [Planctomycetota bacterium]